MNVMSYGTLFAQCSTVFAHRQCANETRGQGARAHTHQLLIQVRLGSSFAPMAQPNTAACRVKRSNNTPNIELSTCHHKQLLLFFFPTKSQFQKIIPSEDLFHHLSWTILGEISLITRMITARGVFPPRRTWLRIRPFPRAYLVFCRVSSDKMFSRRLGTCTKTTHISPLLPMFFLWYPRFLPKNLQFSIKFFSNSTPPPPLPTHTWNESASNGEGHYSPTHTTGPSNGTT